MLLIQIVCGMLLFALPAVLQGAQTQHSFMPEEISKKPVVQKNHDLQIINPIVYINMKEPQCVKNKDGALITRYKVKAVFFLWNTGKTAYRIPTRVWSSLMKTGTNASSTAYTGDLNSVPKGTLLISYDLVQNTAILPAENRPQIPVVLSESQCNPVELRPGEAASFAFDQYLPGKQLEQVKELVFEIKSGHRGRYSFWEGKVYSAPYSLALTKTFHIIK